MYGEKGLGPTKDSGFRVYGRGMATFFFDGGGGGDGGNGYGVCVVVVVVVIVVCIRKIDV